MDSPGKIRAVFIAAILAFAVSASAADEPKAPLAPEAVVDGPFAFLPSVSFRNEKSSDNSGIIGNTEVNVLTTDIKVGYVLQSGLYLGAALKFESSTFSGGEIKGYAAGASAGWVRDALSAILTFHGYAERRFASGGIESKAAGGLGYQIDLAYLPELTHGFKIGPQLSYRSVKFARTQLGTAAETDRTLEASSFVPMIAFGFRF